MTGYAYLDYDKTISFCGTKADAGRKSDGPLKNVFYFT